MWRIEPPAPGDPDFRGYGDDDDWLPEDSVPADEYSQARTGFVPALPAADRIRDALAVPRFRGTRAVPAAVIVTSGVAILLAAGALHKSSSRAATASHP